jgi:DNA repair exonuclease SbcCD ATPase subunit
MSYSFFSGGAVLCEDSRLQLQLQVLEWGGNYISIMMFNSVILENFGIVKSFSISFNRNIVIISGNNGSGKSTILKAIMLAVFDEYDGTLADYINWDSGSFRVIVGFSHRGVQYESTVCYDGTTDRTLCFGNEVLKGEEVKKKIKEIFDVDLLKAAMLAVEQQIDVVNTKPAERRDYLKRIYDIEFKYQISVLEAEIKEHELELAKRTATQTEIENRQYSVPETLVYPFGKIEYELSKSNLELERKTLSDIESQLRIYQQTKSNADKLIQESKRLDMQIESANKEIIHSNNLLEGLPGRKRILLEELKLRKTNQFKANDKEFADSTTRSVSLENERKSILLERLPLFNNEEYTRISQELYTKRSKLKELQNAKDVCPTCGQKISSPEHIEKRKTEIKGLINSISNLTNQFINLSASKKNREESEERNKQKTDRKVYLDNQLALEAEKQKAIQARGQSAIEKIDSETDRLDSDIASEEKYLREIISTKEKSRDNLTAQLQSIQKSLDEAQAKIKEVPDFPLETTKQKIAELENSIKSYDDIVSRNQEIEKMKRQVILQKELDVKQLEIIKDEVQVLNKLIADAKFSAKLLKTEFPIYVISRVVKDIEKSMNDFLRKTYGGRYSVEVSDKKNALRILYGPKKKDVSLASGYEKQIFSSAFRLALCHAMGNKSVLLDEVDSAASEKNSEILYNVLGGLVGNGIEQMIVISHKSSTRSLLESDYDAEVITFENGVAS